MKKISYLLAIILLAALLAALGACGSKVTLSFVSEGNTVAELSGRAGDDLTEKLPDDPTREGYTFEGWYLNEDGSGDRQTLPTVMPETDVTYYAKWRGSDAGDLYTLTLVSNDGGTLANTSYSVQAGTDLLQFLADKTPTAVKNGLTFAGWYLGNRAVSEGFAVDYDITVTAKYSAEYTVDVYTMNTDGSYPTTAQSTKDSAFYGETFDCGASIAVPEHFSVDTDASGSKLTSEALGVSEHFAVYLQRDRYYVYFQANAPQGSSQVGDSQPVYYYYGQEFTTSESTVRLTIPHRLLGWSLTPGGEIWKKVGETITLDSNITLYACWQRAYIDMFGGGDVLYPQQDDPTIVCLHRANEEDRFGFLDENGAFYFTDDGTAQGKVTLNGRISGNYFYYYRDILEKSYPDMDGSDDTIAIGPQGSTIYTHNGSAIEGIYIVDVDSGYFRFEPNDGDENNTFLFNLFESTADGTVFYRRQNLDELGVYAVADNHVIELDGLGGLTYRYNSDNYEYMIAGTPVLEIYGYYEWQEENGFFLAYTRDATSILFEFVFTIDKDAEIPKLDGFENVQFDGVVNRDDSCRGLYLDKWESTTDQLYLDGFGNATYGDLEGTYELITWLYVYEDEESEQDVTADYWLIRFTAGDSIYYFRLDKTYGDFEIDRIITKDQVKEELSEQFGRHDFDRLYAFGEEFVGFVYIFENGGAEVWTAYATVGTGEYAYILYIDFVSDVSRLDDDTYRFGNADPSDIYSLSFDFTVNENGMMEQAFPQEHDIVTVAEGLVLDRTTGIATYTRGDSRTVEVEFDYAEGYVDYYAFAFVIGKDSQGYNLYTYRYFLRIADDNSERFVEIDRTNALIMSEESSYDYTGRLIFVEDKVYLGFMLDNYLYRFIGEGVAEQIGDTEEYSFTLTSWLTSEFSTSDLVGWTEFRYKTVKDASEPDITYFIKSEPTPYQFENMTGDGYGKYTFTEGSTTIVGEITTIVPDEQDKPLLVYLVDSEDKEHIFVVNGNRLTDVTESGDAGYWYEMNDNQLISLYTYFVFDGQGNVYYFLYNSLTYETRVTRGKYERTDRWTQDFLEYDVESDEGGSFYNGTTEISRVLLGEFVVSDNTQIMELPLYQRQIPHRVGEFDVRGGGHISSSGYPAEIATFTTANGTVYYGNMYIGSIYGGETGPVFTNGLDGASTVHFWVYRPASQVGYTATDTHFYFEIVGGRLVQHTLTFGDYDFFDGENTDTTQFIRLGGGGNATIYKNGAEVESGVYTRVEELDAYRYTSATQTFVFRLGYETSNGTTIYVYYIYEEEVDNLYKNANGASLDLDGFGGATYTDGYGRVYNGYAVIFDEAKGYGYFGATGLSRVFMFDNDNGTFEFADHSAHIATYYAQDFSSFVLGEALLTVDGVEYYYLVNGNTITAYPLSGQAAVEFVLPSQDTYTLSNKTYYKYKGGAITFTDREFSQTLTLTFTPSGATFSTGATVNGISNGFSVSVSYGDAGVEITLTYISSSMDAVLESYAVTLHFDEAGNSTFTVVPGGLDGAYTDSTHSDSSITINGKRVGSIIVGDGSVVYKLNYINDSQRRPITATGSYNNLSQTYAGFDFHYGYQYVGKATASDGVEYTFKFYINEAGKQIILSSVTVEQTFTVANAGNVTVAQLWHGVTEYTDYAQYDIVSISMPEDGVTTTTFQSAIENGSKAALVRQVLNTTSGAYVYEAFVFDVTYKANKIVSSLSLENKYNYAEANQGADYMVRFLYTNESDKLVVHYVLTFTIGEKLQRGATFVKSGDNIFTVTLLDGTQYSAAIRLYGTFTLTVTRL